MTRLLIIVHLGLVELVGRYRRRPLRGARHQRQPSSEIVPDSTESFALAEETGRHLDYSKFGRVSGKGSLRGFEET